LLLQPGYLLLSESGLLRQVRLILGGPLLLLFDPLLLLGMWDRC
jgi:hypothetical protein